MNKTYFIDPNASDNFLEYKLLLELFGYSKGRFIVQYPNDWNKIISSYLEKLEVDGVTRVKIIEDLRKKKNEMIKISREEVDNSNWIECANRYASQFSPCSKLIGRSHDSKVDYSLNDVLLSGLDDGATAQVTFLETIENYRNLIRPIFGMGTEVFLADRFFQLRKISDQQVVIPRRNDTQRVSPFEILSILKNKENIISGEDIISGLNKKYPIQYDYYNFLLEIVRDADQSSKTKKIVIFFEEKKFKDNVTNNDYMFLVEHDISAILKKASLKKISLEYRIIPKNFFSRIHWRLVFCTKCALHIDAGIRFSSKGLKNSASWVAPSALSDLISPYEKYFPN